MHEIGQKLIHQAIQASPGASELAVDAEAVAASLHEMRPQDALEGMLVAQLTSLHNHMMYYMQQSLRNEWESEEYTNRFLKINRQFLASLQALVRYRNRGQYTIVVQNVNVGGEGKAIIGCIQSAAK